MQNSKTPEWVAEGLTLYRQGLSYGAIAAKLGLSVPTIWRSLRLHGCVSRSRKVYSSVMREQGVKLYEAGFSYADIADYFGTSRQGAYYALKQAGCQSRPQLRFGADNHFHRGGETQDDRAQNMIEKAILYGRLFRKPCETCGADGVFKDGRHEVQAHHCDYNRPLDVMWLCQRCHHEWHKNNKAIPVAE
jgi:transposase-like protein